MKNAANETGVSNQPAGQHDAVAAGSLVTSKGTSAWTSPLLTRLSGKETEGKAINNSTEAGPSLGPS